MPTVEITDYSPHEGQVAFHRDPQKCRLLRGAVRSGKTHAMIWEVIHCALRVAQRAGPGATFVIFRKTGPALTDTTQKDFFEQLPLELVEKGSVRTQEGRAEFTVLGGTRVLFRSLDDWRKKGGTSYDAIFLDEAWEFDELDFDMLLGRLSGKWGPRRMVLATNPPTRNHWLYKRFVKDKKEGFSEHVFTTYMNAKNLPPNYIEDLENAWDDARKKRFLWGDWGFTSDNAPVYPDFREDTHSAILKWEPSARLVSGFDFGYRHPAPFLKGTDVLTRRGWIPIESATTDDEVLTLHPKTRRASWERVVRTLAREHTGDVVEWSSNHNEGVALGVTDDHSVWHQDEHGQCRRQSAREAASALSRRLPLAASWAGHGECTFTLAAREDARGRIRPAVTMPMKDWAAFLGIWLSEGSTNQSPKVRRFKDRTYRNYNYNVWIWQKRRDPRIEAILSATPFRWKWMSRSRGWVTNVAQLCEYLRPLGHAREKRVPRVVRDADSGALRAFVQAYTLGDGNKQTGRITTASRLMADDLQEIFSKLGLHAVIAETTIRCGPLFTVSPRRRVRPCLRKRYARVRAVVEEPVYCVMAAKNHIILTRRHGKPAWCGNCVWLQMLPTGHLEYLHEMVGENVDIKTFAKRFKIETETRFPNAFPKMIHYVDVAGRQKNDMGTSSVLELLKEGIRPRYRKLPLMGTVQQLRDMIRMSHLGKPMVRTDRIHCPILTEAFQGGYGMDPDTDEPDKDGWYDHVADAARYAAAPVLISAMIQSGAGKRELLLPPKHQRVAV